MKNTDETNSSKAQKQIKDEEVIIISFHNVNDKIHGEKIW